MQNKFWVSYRSCYKLKTFFERTIRKKWSKINENYLLVALEIFKSLDPENSSLISTYNDERSNFLFAASMVNKQHESSGYHWDLTQTLAAFQALNGVNSTTEVTYSCKFITTRSSFPASKKLIERARCSCLHNRLIRDTTSHLRVICSQIRFTNRACCSLYL